MSNVLLDLALCQKIQEYVIYFMLTYVERNLTSFGKEGIFALTMDVEGASTVSYIEKRQATLCIL